MRRVIKMLAANVSGKGQGEAHTSFHFSSSPETKVQTPESDALKTTPPHIGTGSQYDVILDSALGPVADMGVQAAMEFLTANKVIVSREDVKADNNKVNNYFPIASTIYVDDLNCLPQIIIFFYYDML